MRAAAVESAKGNSSTDGAAVSGGGVGKATRVKAVGEDYGGGLQRLSGHLSESNRPGNAWGGAKQIKLVGANKNSFQLKKSRFSTNLPFANVIRRTFHEERSTY